jgi:hypothetical protein
MSKSTNRYGNVKYVLRSFIDASPKEPPKEVKTQWSYLDKVSNYLYGSDYFNLSDKIRLEIHSILNNVPEFFNQRARLAQVKLL